MLHLVVQDIIRSEGIRAARARDQGRVSSIKSNDPPEDQSQDAESIIDVLVYRLFQF